MIHCPSSAAILPTYGWFTYLPSAGYWSEEAWLRLLHPAAASAAINIADQNDRVLRFTRRLSITREWGLRDTLNRGVRCGYPATKFAARVSLHDASPCHTGLPFNAFLHLMLCNGCYCRRYTMKTYLRAVFVL